MQYNDEKQIQYDIQDAGCRQSKQRDLRLAHTAENGCFEVIQQDYGHSQEINPQIQKSQREDLIRHMEQAKQRSGNQLADNGDGGASKHGCHNRGMNSLVYGSFVSVADSMGDDHIAAQGDSDEQVYNQADDGTV